MRDQLEALVTTWRGDSGLSMREADRYANQGNQEQANRAIGLAAGTKRCADELEAALSPLPAKGQAALTDDQPARVVAQRARATR